MVGRKRVKAGRCEISFDSKGSRLKKSRIFHIFLSWNIFFYRGKTSLEFIARLNIKCQFALYEIKMNFTIGRIGCTRLNFYSALKFNWETVSKCLVNPENQVKMQPISKENWRLPVFCEWKRWILYVTQHEMNELSYVNWAICHE